MKITNPVLTGFHADPSMIRVTAPSSIANSPFQCFPPLPLPASTAMFPSNTFPYPLAAAPQDEAV